MCAKSKSFSMRIFILSLFLVFALNLSAQIPAGYYNNAQGKKGQALREALGQIIRNGHNPLSYSDLWTAFEKTDVRNGNQVWDIYSDIPGGTPPYVFYYGGNDQCGTYHTEGDCYNREHSFPKSWFNDDTPMYTDLFHIYPTDGYVNNRRGNYPYGEVSNPSWTSENGSKLGPCSYPGYTGTVFEPIDAYKGDLARSYFYMLTRYYDQIATWSSPVLDTSDFSPWARKMLLEWALRDPVSQKEINRNDSIYKIQGNRNPFIDHPEYAWKIWAYVKFNSSPVTAVNPGSYYSYWIKLTGPDTTKFSAKVISAPSWLNFDSIAPATYHLYSSAPVNQTGDYQIQLMAVNYLDTAVQEYTLSVAQGASEQVFKETFDNCPLTGWTVYSISSNHDWQCNASSSYASMNNYGADQASDDWLITPAIDLSNYKNPVLTFQTWTRYTDSGVDFPGLYLYVSTDYQAGDNPNSYTWQELSFDYPGEDSQTWKSSGNIDLSNFSGKKIYIGFEYKSSGTSSGQCRLWELDSVVVQAQQVSTNLVNSIDRKYAIYPNPLTTNAIHIAYYNNTSGKIKVKITNLGGSSLFSNVYSVRGNGELTINKDIKPGIYIIQIDDGTHKDFLKIIKL